MIAEVVGPEQALAVGRRLAGTTPKFPALSTLERAARDARIRREAAHCSQTDLCERYNLSRWQLARILKKK